MELLPLSLLRNIFARVEAAGDGTDAAVLPCVCKRWRAAFEDQAGEGEGEEGCSWRLHSPNPYLLHFERAMHDRALVPLELFERCRGRASADEAAGHRRRDRHDDDPLGLLRYPRLLALYHKLTRVYSFAIPSDEALRCLAAHQPLIELGAGNGYWAALLRQRGVPVVALDVVASARPSSLSWTRVEACADGVAAMVAHMQRDKGADCTHEDEKEEDETADTGRHPQPRGKPGYALFLCWPPWRHPMASEALSAYEREGGRTVIYIGHESCTGDTSFHRQLENRWRLERAIDIPRWPLLPDRLFLYYHQHREVDDGAP